MKRAAAFFVHAAFLMLAVFLMLVVFSFGFLNATASTEDEPGVNVIFIMDFSGTMKQADRERVSLTSVAIFADFLGESTSQIGFVLFGDGVLETMPLTPVDQARARIRNNVMTREFDSPWTDIPSALDSALALFDQSSSTNKEIAILFTDGNVDLPRSSGLTNRQGEDKCREISQAYRDAGIPLYTVGLNHDGSLNEDFIRELSALSSSPGRSAESHPLSTNWEIPATFSKIYISIFNGSSDVGLNFDASEGSKTAVYNADEGLFELNVLLIHENQLDNLTIRDPSGNIYPYDSFIQRDGYSFVKIRYPDVGDWEFSFRGDYISANKLVRYVTNTGRSLIVTFNTDGGAALGAVSVPRGGTLPEIPKPVKEGFSFEGWYLNEAKTEQFYSEKTFSRDTVLYAKWVALAPQVLWKITFTGEGFTEQTNLVPDGDRAINHLPPEPARKGFTFGGWRLSNETLINQNTIINQDMVFTALWDELEINLIPFILLIALSGAIFIVGKFFRKRLFSEVNIEPELLSTGFSVLFTITFTLACWSLLKAYIIPIEILSAEPAGDEAALTFTQRIDLFALGGGLIAPILSNGLLSGILPYRFVGNASVFEKEKQYLIHLILTLSGLIWPLTLLIMYGAGMSLLWLVLYAFVVHSAGFFVSAFLFRQGDSPKCNRFFLDLYLFRR